MREHHRRIARDIGGVDNSLSVISEQTITATEYLAGEVARIDIHVGITIDIREVTAAEDVTIHIRCLRCGAVERHVGITRNLSYEFGVQRLASHIRFTLFSSVSASKDRATDIGVAADFQIRRLIAFIHYPSHIAAAIYILIERTAADAHYGATSDEGHVGEGTDCLSIFKFCVRHTITATEHWAMERTAIDIHLHIAEDFAEIGVF